MKAFFGLAIGSVLTYLFLNYGYTPPEIFQMPNKLKAIPEQLIASSFVEDPNAVIKQKQNAVATLIKFDPKYYVEIDNSIGNLFTEKAVERITDRRITLLKEYAKASQKAFDKDKYPELYEYMKKRYKVDDLVSLQKRMLIEKLKEDLLVYQELQKKFPNESDEHIAAKLLNDL